MDVYIVHAGEYSDRYVEAVFSDRDKADQYAILKHLEGREPYSVEEFAVDEIVIKEPVATAFVTLKDGEDISMRVSPDSLYKKMGCSHKHVFIYNCQRRRPYGTIEVLVVCGTGKDIEHALKSARDNRARVLAVDAGIS